jgi:hypothetical protein
MQDNTELSFSELPDGVKNDFLMRDVKRLDAQNMQLRQIINDYQAYDKKRNKLLTYKNISKGISKKARKKLKQI